jgi:hypothetical protein
MDKPGFIQYLKKGKKSSKAVNHYVCCAEVFEAYLAELGKTLSNCQPQDLRCYAEEAPQGHFKDFQGIAAYYEYIGNEVMWLTAHELWSAEIFNKFELREFLDVNLRCHPAKACDIVTAQMLEAGRTPELRLALANETGVSQEHLLDLVKLSDLARIAGLKRIRARLYYDAGFDTLDKIAALDPEALRSMLVEFVSLTGLDAIPPTPKEAAYTVAWRHLPRSWLDAFDKERRLCKEKSKPEIIQQLQAERRRLEANLSRLTPQNYLMPGVVGEWSVKDILAHLAHWEARMPVWIEAARRGDPVETPSPGLTWQQLDLFNQQIYAEHRDQSLDEVMAYFQDTHRQFCTW